MIEFTLPDGNPVAINPAAIDYVRPADDATLISFTGSNSVTVSEHYPDVLAMLKVTAANHDLTTF